MEKKYKISVRIWNLISREGYMELDVRIDNDSLAISIANPFRLDIDSVTAEIEVFASSKGDSLTGLDIKSLLPRMVKGIAGCERGCPADAKKLVMRGVKNFRLEYIEGGILSASAVTSAGRSFCIKMFPEF